MEQAELVFNVHRVENNSTSQKHLDKNRGKFNATCSKVYARLMAGERLTVRQCAIDAHQQPAAPRARPEAAECVHQRRMGRRREGLLHVAGRPGPQPLELRPGGSMSKRARFAQTLCLGGCFAYMLAGDATGCAIFCAASFLILGLAPKEKP